MTFSQVRAYALSLPEATEEPHFARTSFRVGGKIFATARAGEGHIHVFVGESERDHALESCPRHMHKLWWGKKVVGVRIDLDKAPIVQVKKLLRSAWSAMAPASLKGAKTPRREQNLIG